MLKISGGTDKSDIGLHCLPVSILWDARNKWIKSVICVSLVK